MAQRTLLSFPMASAQQVRPYHPLSFLVVSCHALSSLVCSLITLIIQSIGPFRGRKRSLYEGARTPCHCRVSRLVMLVITLTGLLSVLSMIWGRWRATSVYSVWPWSVGTTSRSNSSGSGGLAAFDRVSSQLDRASWGIESD
jgi:hypothetical protein